MDKWGQASDHRAPNWSQRPQMSETWKMTCVGLWSLAVRGHQPTKVSEMPEAVGLEEAYVWLMSKRSCLFWSACLEEVYFRIPLLRLGWKEQPPWAEEQTEDGEWLSRSSSIKLGSVSTVPRLSHSLSFLTLKQCLARTVNRNCKYKIVTEQTQSLLLWLLELVCFLGNIRHFSPSSFE